MSSERDQLDINVFFLISLKLNDQTFLLEKILYGREGVPGNLEYMKALLQRLSRV